MLRGLNVGVTVSKATLKFLGSAMGSMRTFFLLLIEPINWYRKNNKNVSSEKDKYLTLNDTYVLCKCLLY